MWMTYAYFDGTALHLCLSLFTLGQVEGPTPAPVVVPVAVDPAAGTVEGPRPAPTVAVPVAVGPPAIAPPIAPRLDPAVAGDWARLRARQRQTRGLTAGGFAGFGAAYIGNFVGGIRAGVFGEDPTSIVGLLPVAGPFVFAAWERGSPGWQTFFVLDGLAQAGFLAAGIGGAVVNKRTRRALAHPRFLALDARLAARLDGDPDLIRRGRLGGWLLAGFAGFGLAYVGTGAAFMTADTKKLVTSDTDIQRIWAVVPLAGPFVVAGQADLAGTKALAAILGLVQVGSLATGIAGAVIRTGRKRDAQSRVLHEVGVSPWHSVTTTGLMIRGRF